MVLRHIADTRDNSTPYASTHADSEQVGEAVEEVELLVRVVLREALAQDRRDLLLLLAHLTHAATHASCMCRVPRGAHARGARLDRLEVLERDLRAQQAVVVALVEARARGRVLGTRGVRSKEARKNVSACASHLPLCVAHQRRARHATPHAADAAAEAKVVPAPARRVHM